MEKTIDLSTYIAGVIADCRDKQQDLEFVADNSPYHCCTPATRAKDFEFFISILKKIRNRLSKMDPNDYQRLAMRTCSICDSDGDKLMHGVLGLTSEAGEVAGIFQKVYQGHPDPAQDKEAKAHLVKECGDCLWMIAEILDAIHVPMSDCMTANINKLRARYPDGFEPDKSLHRKQGDI